jgi:hypothetical protein
MRVVRRLAFAAPFVLVVACKKPVAEPREPAHEDEPPTGFAAMPTSSMPEPPPDAAVPDAQVDTGIARVNGCTDRRVMPRPNCNPPPPEFERQMNPPRPVIARVINVQVQDSTTILVVGIGTDRGISTEWKACLINDNEVCRSGGDLVMIRVDKTMSRLRSTATTDQIVATPKVKLFPP